MNERHGITIAIALCLSYSILGAEWTWGFSGGVFFLLRATSRIVPSVCLLFLFFRTGGLNVHGGTRSAFTLLGALMILCSLFLSQFESGNTNIVSVFDYSFVGVFQAILFAYIGYWIAQDPRECWWLLKKIALACAWSSALGGLMRFANSEVIPFLVPGWPTRLIFLFGYCWYLHEWLIARKWKALLGVAACSVDVLFSMHKPVVFSTLIASVFLVVYTTWATKQYVSIFKNVAVIVTLSFVSLYVLNAFTSGTIFLKGEEIFMGEFLHVQGDSRAELSVPSIDLEKAAGGRFDIWAEASAKFRAHPVFGSGFGQYIETAGESGGLGDNVYLHNWYVDILVSVGIFGSIPIFLGVIWWVRLVTKRKVIRQSGNIVVPCLAYFFGVMAYNLGGSILVFFSMCSFVALVMAIAARLADQTLLTGIGGHHDPQLR